MENKICPRCKENYLEDLEVLNALSRRDNETYICSECGIDEAMEDYFGLTTKNTKWLKEVKKDGS